MIGVRDFINSYREGFDAEKQCEKEARTRLKEARTKLTYSNIEAMMNEVYAEWNEKRLLGIDIHKQIRERYTSANVFYEGIPDEPLFELKKIKRKDDDEDEDEDESENNTDVDDSGPEYIIEEKLDPIAVNKVLNGNVYLEKKVYSHYFNIVGYADKVEVKNNFINIEDVKVTDRIHRSSAYTMKNGFKIAPSFFYPPIENVMSCNYYEAALQMSLYMYILWTYNKHLKPGSLNIRHVKTSDSGKIIYEKLIETPYMVDEIRALLQHHNKNKD